jgi:hypothetical protein
MGGPRRLGRGAESEAGRCKLVMLPSASPCEDRDAYSATGCAFSFASGELCQDNVSGGHESSKVFV